MTLPMREKKCFLKSTAIIAPVDTWLESTLASRVSQANADAQAVYIKGHHERAEAEQTESEGTCW